MTSLSHPAVLAARPVESCADARSDLSDAIATERPEARKPAFERLVRTLILWHHRSRSRAALRTLDERLLRDIGLDRETAQRVAAKRFWQD